MENDENKYIPPIPAFRNKIPAPPPVPVAFDRLFPSSTLSDSRFQSPILPRFPNLNVLTVPTPVAASASSYNTTLHEGNSPAAASNEKVKFLCSFGGKILPRPSDGVWRYVGGHTRIFTLDKDITFPDLVCKLTHAYQLTQTGGVVLKYQLPHEHLDALVSVSCPEDLENMMEEYEKLLKGSDGSAAKLRLFLFSASDLDAPALMRFTDFSHKYIDAVNGILDVTTPSPSATPTHNSDSPMSATEGVVPSFQANAQGGGLLPPNRSSPIVASPDASTRLVCVAPNPVIFTQNPTTLPIISGPPQPIPVPQVVGKQPHRYEFHQPSAMSFEPTAAYTHTYHQEMQRAPQIGDLNPQTYGMPRPLFRHAEYQQQIHDNTAALNPSVLMTAASDVNVGPNVTRQFMQPHQPRVYQNPEGSSFGAKIAQLPSENIYNGFEHQPAKCSDQLQVPSSEYVVCSSGNEYPRHILFPETPISLDACNMCQKALPHAHSDTLIHDKVDSLTSKAPDSAPIFHSLCSENIAKVRALKRVVVSGPTEGEIVEHQGAKTRLTVAKQVNQNLIAPQLGVFGFGQSPVVQHDVDNMLLLNTDDPWVPPGATGLDGKGPLPCVLFPGKTTLPYQPFRDHLKPIDGRIKAGYVNPPVLSVKNEQYRVLHNQPWKGEIWDSRSHMMEQGTINVFSQPGVAPGVNQRKNVERLLYSPKVDYLHNLHPVEPILSTQPVTSCISQPYAHLDTVTQHITSDLVWKDKLAFSGVDSAYDTDMISVGARRGLSPSFYSRLDLNGNSPTTVSPSSSIVGDDMDLVQSNSLFIDQNPWTLQHDTHFPPPRPNKVVGCREVLDSGDEIGLSLLSDNPKMDVKWGQEGYSQEEHVKEELKAVAEGVATAVLKSPIPSDPSLLEMSETIHEASQCLEFPSDSFQVQVTSEAEIVNTMLLDKSSPTLPNSDGIGRLQIITNSDLEELRELGSGTFGTVYHGKWRGTDVAIKRINTRCFTGKPSEQDRMRGDFWNEAINLADLHHPNVVAFYGIVLDGPGGSVATVTEYMVNGSLRQALQRNDRTLDKRKRILIAMDVAFGMEYLHGKKVVHFDLKSDNLLVNLRDPHRPICKVGDLGLSKVKRQTLISGGVRGTLPWMAPELLNGSRNLVSEKVDVFSFGIVLWELLTGEEPYADLHYGAIIGGIVSNTLRPTVPESCDPVWRSLMEWCWLAEPSKRPSFTEIAERLRCMAACLPVKGQAQPTQTTGLKVIAD